MKRRDFMRLGLAAGCIGSHAAELLAGEAPIKSRLPAADPVGVVQAAKDVLKQVGRRDLERSVQLACQWLTDLAQVRGEQLEQRDTKPNYHCANWSGAIRNEYGSERTWGSNGEAGKWGFYDTLWHTGQACKALALAARYFKDEAMLTGAKLAAGFISRRQTSDPSNPHYGVITAYDGAESVWTSEIFETCDGLFVLSATTGDPQYARRACSAIRWVADRLYAGEGRFYDAYAFGKGGSSPGKVWKDKEWNGQAVFKDRWGHIGRPLWDDGVLLTAAKQTKDERLQKIFFDVADRLLRTEDPPGNWMAFHPCDWRAASIHPRQAFWFGRPMWMAYLESGQRKYRDCFDRACQWYVRAMRRDGGMLRNTYADFNTDSFGHAGSGTGCACMMFRDQYAQLGNTAYLPHLIKGLKYLQSMQFVDVKDPNLRGAILEKVLPPKGRDASPWYVRDIGASFFIIAASHVLLDAASRTTQPTKTT
jgi:hypothetical protein